MADEKVAVSSPEVQHDDEKRNSPDIAPMEHVELGYEDLSKDHMNWDRVDSEVAKYANDVAIDISPEENSRLKRLVDKRVLSIMVFTYFLQVS